METVHDIGIDDIGVDNPLYFSLTGDVGEELPDSDVRYEAYVCESKYLHQSPTTPRWSSPYLEDVNLNTACFDHPLDWEGDSADDGDDDDIYVGPDGQHRIDTSREGDLIYCLGPQTETRHYTFPSSDNGRGAMAMRNFIEQYLSADLVDDRGFFLDVREIPEHELAGWQAKLWRDVPFAGARQYLVSTQSKLVEAICQDLACHYVFVIRSSTNSAAPCDYPFCAPGISHPPSQNAVYLSLEPFAGWETLKPAMNFQVAGGEIIVFERIDNIGIPGFSLHKHLNVGVVWKFCISCLEDLWYQHRTAGLTPLSIPESFEPNPYSFRVSPEWIPLQENGPLVSGYENTLEDPEQGYSKPNNAIIQAGSTSATYFNAIMQDQLALNCDLLSYPELLPYQDSWSQARRSYQSAPDTFKDLVEQSAVNAVLDCQEDEEFNINAFLDLETRAETLDGVNESMNIHLATARIIREIRQMAALLAVREAVQPVQPSSAWNSVNQPSNPDGGVANVQPYVQPYVLPPFSPDACTLLSEDTPKLRPPLRGEITRTEVRTAGARIGMPVYPCEQRFVDDYKSPSPAPSTPRRNATALLPLSPPAVTPSQPHMPGSCSPSPSAVARLPIRLRTPSTIPHRGAETQRAENQRKYQDIKFRMDRTANTDAWLAEVKHDYAMKRKAEADEPKCNPLMPEPQAKGDRDPNDEYPIPTHDELDALLAKQQKEEQKEERHKKVRRDAAASYIVLDEGPEGGDLIAFRKAYHWVDLRFCSCGGRDDAKPMVECKDTRCEIGLYHMACLSKGEELLYSSYYEDGSARADIWVCNLCLARRKREKKEAEEEAKRALEQLERDRDRKKKEVQMAQGAESSVGLAMDL